MIDPCSRWYGCEQCGPALDTWLDIWQSASPQPSNGDKSNHSDHNDYHCNNNNKDNDDDIDDHYDNSMDNRRSLQNLSNANKKSMTFHNSNEKHTILDSNRSPKETVLANKGSSRDFQPVRRSRAIGSNLASSYDYCTREKNDLLHNSLQCYPWMNASSKYDNSIDGLDQELVDFYSYIKPTDNERFLRCILYRSLYNILKFHFPDSFIDTYGSFKTDLFLPTSDIDIVIFNSTEKTNLNSFRQVLIDSRLCINDTIIILDKAVVPIIKFRSAQSNIRVDITFKSSNATKVSNYIKNAMQIFPAIKILIVTLKQFLLQRNANEVYYGGISSYSLILMTISFLKCIPKTSPSITIGKLLLGFLDFYGNQFDYLNQAVAPTSLHGIVSKSSLVDIFGQSPMQPSLLCIQDPVDPTNDVGKSSFGVLKIKSYFSAAYSCLISAIYSHKTLKFHSEKHPQTLLGRIITITPEIIDYRREIDETSKQLICSLPMMETDFHIPSDFKDSNYDKIIQSMTSLTSKHKQPMQFDDES